MKLRQILSGSFVVVAGALVAGTSAQAGTISNNLSIRDASGTFKTNVTANVDSVLKTNATTNYAKTDVISEAVNLPDGAGVKYINSTINVSSTEYANLNQTTAVTQTNSEYGSFNQFDQTVSAGMSY